MLMAGGGIIAIDLVIAANTTNYDIKAAAMATGWNGVSPAEITLTINSGATVYSSSTGAFALTTGASYPNMSSLKLINNGTVLGKGGNGGAGSSSSTNPVGGGAGGPAFQASVPISVTNNGRIAGGGGGGGGGGTIPAAGQPGGGGGGGICNGLGGAAPQGTGYNPGAAATLTSAGAGGTVDGANSWQWRGGDGGSYGSGGGSGTEATGAAYTAGGPAGACTSGNSNITWLVAGTRNGALN